MNHDPSDLKNHSSNWQEASATIQTYIQAGRYKDVVELVIPFAKKGVSDAQNLLGWLYANLDLADGDEAALEWWTKAAQQNHPVACFVLGTLYQHGRGVEQSFETASQWYAIAAKLNNPSAQNNLGILLSLGLGNDKNLPEAHAWFSIAFENGYDEALKNKQKVELEMTTAQLLQSEALIQTGEIFSPKKS